MPLKKISIVVPVYNEEENVDSAYDAVRGVMEPLSDRYDYELVFTDNHSADGTFDKIKAVARKDPRVRVFRFSRNFGYQRSILTGYLKARGDAVIQLDCDLQDPPDLIPAFLRLWEEGFDVVYGVRRSRRENPLMTAVRKIFYRAIDFLSEDDLPHDAGDFRLVDRKIVSVLSQLDDAQPYLRGTIASMGFKQVGLEYDRAQRSKGESKFSLGAMVGLSLDGILNHSIVPLRLASYTGIVAFFLGGAGALLYAIGKTVFFKNWPPGFATIVILLFFILGINSILLGVIGEYLGRIFRQLKTPILTVIEASSDDSPHDRGGIEIVARKSAANAGSPQAVP